MNTIGLDKDKSAELVTKLNVLLANFQVHYQNLRGLHWNIKGENFFELHVKFEEFYLDAQEKIDQIAERILTLEGVPLHTFEAYLRDAFIPIGQGVHKDKEAVDLVLLGMKELLLIERGLLELSGEADDEGTNSMMSDFITEQEKTIWMLRSWRA
ncbi:DNA starvation/stationary phase protection protein [Flavobacteriaceae bacterium]|nr:DNA starvation/stationary phase protection protein [Flavobacteriaceae bacterium]